MVLMDLQNLSPLWRSPKGSRVYIQRTLEVAADAQSSSLFLDDDKWRVEAFAVGARLDYSIFRHLVDLRFYFRVLVLWNRALALLLC